MAARWLTALNDALNYGSLAGFAILFAFFCAQYRRGRCKWEVIFVCGTSFLFSGVYFFFPDDVPARIVVQGLAEGRSVPWVRFGGYLITCPVLLLHLSNLRGEANYDTIRAMQLVGTFQCVVLMGTTAAMCIDDGMKLFFHLTGACFACAMFYRAHFIFKEAFASLPQQARGHLYVLAFCFFGGWSAFGLTFNLGPEGWAFIDPVAHNVIVRIADIITKHVYAMVGWSLRWRVLYPLTKAGMITKTESGFEDNSRSLAPTVLYIAGSTGSGGEAVFTFWRTRMKLCGAKLECARTLGDAMAKIRKKGERRKAPYAFILAPADYVRRNLAQFDSPDIRVCPLVVVVTDDVQEGTPIGDFLSRIKADDMIPAPFRQEDVSTVAKYWIIKWYGTRLREDAVRESLEIASDSFEGRPSGAAHKMSTVQSFTSLMEAGSVSAAEEVDRARWTSPSFRNLKQLMLGGDGGAARHPHFQDDSFGSERQVRVQAAPARFRSAAPPSADPELDSDSDVVVNVEGGEAVDASWASAALAAARAGEGRSSEDARATFASFTFGDGGR